MSHPVPHNAARAEIWELLMALPVAERIEWVRTWAYIRLLPEAKP